MKISNLAEAEHHVLECRHYGHAWKWQSDRPDRNRFGMILSWVQNDVCLRCTSERSRLIMADGFDVHGTTMAYVDGYLATKGNRFRRNEVRQELMMRRQS